MNVKVYTTWDDDLFKDFIHFKAAIQGHLETYFPESLEDYKKLLHPTSVFAMDYRWIAVVVQESSDILAKAILSWKDGSVIGNLGFIDWVNQEEVAHLLMKSIEDQAQTYGLKQIKTPVDLNFFVKYRIKCPGGGDPFFGEPVYPDYYHQLYQVTGYHVVGEWDTYRLSRWQTIKNFTKKRKQLTERKHKNSDNLVVRGIRLSDWDNELRIVYGLFVKSFQNMPEFESITFDQFKCVYDDFKYIIHPWYALIVELDGNPVGFNITYPDPLPVLMKVKGKNLNQLQKILLLAKLRLNYKTLLIAYIGKIPGPNGEEIKGVIIKISKRISALGFGFKRPLLCYVSKDSPSRRVLDSGGFSSHSKYVLYGKDLK